MTKGERLLLIVLVLAALAFLIRLTGPDADLRFDEVAPLDRPAP